MTTLLTSPIYFYTVLLIWSIVGIVLIQGVSNFIQHQLFSKTESKHDDKALSRIRNIAAVSYTHLFSSLPALEAHTRMLLGKKLEYRVTEKIS